MNRQGDAMSQIEVTDWVAADVLSRYSALRIERGDGEPWPPELSIQQRQEDMRAAITAALGAWVVPVPQFGDASSDSEWFDGELSDTSKDDPFYKIRTLYTLRQEKPE